MSYMAKCPLWSRKGYSTEFLEPGEGFGFALNVHVTDVQLNCVLHHSVAT